MNNCKSTDFKYLSSKANAEKKLFDKGAIDVYNKIINLEIFNDLALQFLEFVKKEFNLDPTSVISGRLGDSVIFNNDVFRKIDKIRGYDKINAENIRKQLAALEKPTQEIKPGVAELFESNESLANAVYEALGFIGDLNKLKVQDMKTKVSNIADTLENTKKELLDIIKNSTIVDTHKEVMSKVVEGVFSIPGSNPLIQDDTDTYKEYNPKKFTDYINYELGDRFNEKQLRNIISNNNANLLETIFLKHKLALLASEEGVSGLPENLAELELAKITPQQKQQATLLYSQYLESLNKPNTNPILQDNQQEQVKKFAELQERLNNKEFLEGAKNAFESSKGLQEWGTQEQYNDYIARVSLGIIKNPSSGEYNYTSKVKDIVYHKTDVFDTNFTEKEINDKIEFFRKKGIIDDLELLKSISISSLSKERGKLGFDKFKKGKLGFYFASDKEVSGGGQFSKDAKSFPFIINIQNPEYSLPDYSISSPTKGFDGVITSPSNNSLNKWYVVFEPEQIHVLSSKQDIENFANFVKNNNIGNIETMQNYMDSKSVDYIMDKLIQSGKIEKKC